ncbi:response regulator [Vibrio sp. JCM 19052]|nr:response regulator [Vibrio sp. JCM 19052]
MGWKRLPKGISGEQIPLSARIVAIADVFDALTSERPYKRAWSIPEACALLTKESGTHFDPKLVPVFISLIPEIKKSWRVIRMLNPKLKS